MDFSSSSDSDYNSGTSSDAEDDHVNVVGGDPIFEHEYAQLKPLLRLIWLLTVRNQNHPTINTKISGFCQELAHTYARRGLWNYSPLMVNLANNLPGINSYVNHSLGNAVLDIYNTAHTNVYSYI